LPAQRRKLSVSGCARRDRRERASWNSYATGCADCLLGGAVVESAKSFMSFWQAIIVPPRTSAIAITGRERSVMPGHSRSWNGVATLAFAGVHDFDFRKRKNVDGRNKSGHDEFASLIGGL
jgi:hypothetical protein